MRRNGKAKRNVLPSGHPDSYYAATANATAAQPQLAGSVYADACVIGGGFTGISAALHLAGRLDSGQVYVNVWMGPTIETPFGGFKMSGYGREKGLEALAHYTHTKSVTVAL